MKKKIISCLVVGTMSISAQNALAQFYPPSYSIGPYFNAGLGGTIFTIPDFFDNNDITVGSMAGRVGLGYIGDINQSENPFLYGFEFNGNYYSLTSGSQGSLFGGDASLILGKQLAYPLAIYGKIGGALITDGHISSFGPQVGAGVGVQFTPHIRLTGETDFAAEIANGFFSVATFMGGLQYSF